MNPINLRKIRVQSFSIESSSSLNYGNSVVIGVSGDVVQITGNDNHDGTQNVTYTVKPVVIQVDKVIENALDKEKLTIAKTETAGKSRSKMLRAKAYRIGLELGENEETLYAAAMDEASEWLENHRLSVIGYPEK